MESIESAGYLENRIDTNGKMSVVRTIRTPDGTAHRTKTDAEFRSTFQRLRLEFGPDAPLKIRSERVLTEAARQGVSQ